MPSSSEDAISDAKGGGSSAAVFAAAAAAAASGCIGGWEECGVKIVLVRYN